MTFDSGLLLCFAVAGLLKGRSKKTEPTTVPPPAEPDVAAASPEIEAFRAINQVRLLDPDDEGAGVAHLPSGVYGFTFAPNQESPLFRRRIHQAFEVHKLHDGTIVLVGFVTEKERDEMSVPERYLDVTLYPEPWENSTKAVCIPRERMLRAKGPSRSDGNPLYLELGPANTTIQ